MVRYHQKHPTSRQKKKEIEYFIDYLNIKQLSYQTIKTYLMHYALFDVNRFQRNPKKYSLIFLSKSVSNVRRAFLKNYFEFRDIPVNLPMISGRRKHTYPNILSYAELKAMRVGLYAYRYDLGIMFDLIYYGALRKQEVLNIRWSDFNFENWKDLDAKSCKLKVIGKGYREREILIPKEIIANLKNLYLSYSILIDTEIHPDELVFREFAGKTPETLNRYYYIVSKALLNRKIFPHLIRHTRATRLYEKGINVYDIKQYLGHSSIATTELYLHPDLKKMLKRVEKITELERHI